MSTMKLVEQLNRFNRRRSFFVSNDCKFCCGNNKRDKASGVNLDDGPNQWLNTHTHTHTGIKNNGNVEPNESGHGSVRRQCKGGIV